MTASDKPVLEFWFEFGSNYSYLSVMRIEALAFASRPFFRASPCYRCGWRCSARANPGWALSASA